MPGLLRSLRLASISWVAYGQNGTVTAETHRIEARLLGMQAGLRTTV
jgi:hypothetical protein